MRKKILLLLLSVSYIYSACTDEDLLVPRGVKQPEYVDDSPLVKVAKAYVNGTEGRFSLPDAAVTFSRELTRSSHEPAFTVNNGEVTLEWKKAESYDEGDSEVLTVPIKTKNKMTVYRNITKNNKREKGHTPMYSRLIVRKFKDMDYSYSFVASYIPDRAYMKGNKVKHDKYVNRPEGTHYSGLYIVSELNGRMLYGIKYKEGKEEFRFRPNLEKDFYQKMLQQNPNDTIIQGRLKQMKHTSNHLMLKFIGTQALTRASNTGNSNSEYEEVACSTCGGDANECDCYIIYGDYINYGESIYEDYCGNNNNRDTWPSDTDNERAPTQTQQSSNNSSQQNYNGGGASNSPVNTNTKEYFLAVKLPKFLDALQEKFGVIISNRCIIKIKAKLGANGLADFNTHTIVLDEKVLTFTDDQCERLLYHEIYHILYDIPASIVTKTFDSPLSWGVYEELPTPVQEWVGRICGNDANSIYSYMNLIYSLKCPEFYLNEYCAYYSELRLFTPESNDYQKELIFRVYYYNAMYNLSKKYYYESN